MHNIRGKIEIRNSGILELGDNFKITSNKNYNLIGGQGYTSMVVLENAQLKIGKNFGISNSSIYAAKSIKIGDNVAIGSNCKIWDTDFHSIYLKDREEDINIRTNEIVIKNGAWIGGFSTILKGVVIGENSVIAAGSVVTKSIPDNELWGGNPAKFIKKIDQYERTNI